MAKRGLIISFYFPPTGGGGVQRWVKLIKYMRPLDWEFNVISSDYNAEDPKDITLLDDIPANTEIIRIPNSISRINLKSKIPFFKRSGYFQRWISAFLNVTDSREFWNKKASAYIKRELDTKKYDVVILSSPPYSLALLAAELTGSLEIPVVLDLRDPWTINPYKIHPTGMHRYMDKKREEKAIADIQFIISAYESTVIDYRRRIPGFEEKRTLILPNGYDEDDFSDNSNLELSGDIDLNLGFSGSFYSHLNTPVQLFLAIKKLKEENINVCFHHVGSSVQDLTSMAKKHDMEKNLKIWGYKNHRDCLKVLGKMDGLCLILDSNWPNSQYTIGGKFYEYLRLKKPILALVPEGGEASAAVRETESGVIVSDNQVESIVKAIRQLLDSQISLSWKGIERYDRREQARQLHAFLLNEVL